VLSFLIFTLGCLEPLFSGATSLLLFVGGCSGYFDRSKMKVGLVKD